MILAIAENTGRTLGSPSQHLPIISETAEGI